MVVLSSLAVLLSESEVYEKSERCERRKRGGKGGEVEVGSAVKLLLSFQQQHQTLSSRCRPIKRPEVSRKESVVDSVLLPFCLTYFITA
jgi:hypothetical protein